MTTPPGQEQNPRPQKDSLSRMAGYYEEELHFKPGVGEYFTAIMFAVPYVLGSAIVKPFEKLYHALKR